MEGRSRDAAAVGAMWRGRWQAVALMTFFFLVTCIAVGANGNVSAEDKAYLKKELGEMPSDADLRGREKELFHKISTVRNKGARMASGAAIGLLTSLVSLALLGGAARKFKGDKAIGVRNAIALTMMAGFFSSAGVGIKGLVEVGKAQKETAKYRQELVKMVKERKAKEEEEEAASSPPSSKAEDDDAAAVASLLEEKEAKAAAAGSRNGGDGTNADDGQEGEDSVPTVEEVVAQLSSKGS